MAGLSFILGIIGNVISILMFASPIKTFKHVVKKKSTENYNGLPYITTLLSTSLWSYYGLLKTGGLLIVTVNGAGVALHVIYVALFLIYAPNDVKVKYVKLVATINIGFLGAVTLVTQLALHGSLRITLIGILCAGLTIAMYAAPLSVMKTVIQMKSVKYMPFFLSFFQFLNGGVWSAYAVLVKDYYIGVPNGIGFLLGAAQLILYVIYKNKSMAEDPMEEEGSGNLFEGGDRSLSKGNSLPKPSIARQYDQDITKTISLSSCELGVVNDRDIEKGFQESH
ncbi:bidirectional sugar transporter SWEET16-like [Primulina tabacum]|uniref:bidirectional sugar transporter SWEET16-like n=1 Tax=Primulina tabacum TaxID=48773 RepID=UPI003F5A865C